MSDNELFTIGDYVVCPGHGVGQVNRIEKRELGDSNKSFYIIKVVSNGMTVMIPTDSKEGVRSLVGDEEVTSMFNLLSTHDVDVDNSTWNRRHRDYMTKIKTGSILEIADVLRSLFLLKNVKNLSFGERKLLEECKALITKEISIAQNAVESEVSEKIESFFAE